MTRATFIIGAAIAFLSSAAAATSPPVTFESPCECRDNHGEHRLVVKNDPSTPPVDASAIQAVAIVLLSFIQSEGRRLRMRFLWLPMLGTVFVGVSLGLPLFLYLRQLELDRKAI